jgi:AcrR family transcriptional regulator
MATETLSTRDRLCEAAIRTATRDGILAMTLDNVAKEAGVSKGGVMYHFPTKDELVRAMLRYFGQRVETMLLRKVAADPSPSLRWGRALLDCVFPEPGTPSDDPTLTPEVIDQFMLTTLAAAVNTPGLIDPLREVAQKIQAQMLADGEHGMDQLLIWLALDGLFLWQYIGLIERGSPLFEQFRGALRERLKALASRPASAEVRS